MLPGVPDDSGLPEGRQALALTARRGRRRARWLVARDVAGASAVSAAVGLGASVGAHSAAVGTLTGGAIWLASCAGVALIAWLRSFRHAGTAAIDPWALPEPWRGLVRDAVNAGRRFEVATAALPAGPLRDHVTALEPAVAKEVRSVWDSARRGAALTGGFPPGARPEPAASLSERLLSIQEERAALEAGAGGTRPTGRLAELDRAEQAVASQLRQSKHSESVARWLEDGLRSAITRLEAAVTSLAELGLRPLDPTGGDQLGVSLDSVAEELSALQAGLREVAGSLPPAGGVPSNRRKP